MQVRLSPYFLKRLTMVISAQQLWYVEERRESTVSLWIRETKTLSPTASCGTVGSVLGNIRDSDRSQVSIPITRDESYYVEHPESGSDPVPEEDTC